MPTSGSTNYSVTRDDIIKRALRIIGAIGQGETPSDDAITEASAALNQLIKEWQADGMQLWKYDTIFFDLTAGVASYNIGVGQTGTNSDQIPVLKVMHGWLRKTSDSVDTPLLQVTKYDYNLLSNKASRGRPNQFCYGPPRVQVTEAAATVFLFPTPDTTTADDYKLFLLGIIPIYDFDAADDVADFPSFYYNALSWGLADQLSYEYGVPFAQQSMITKKAETHLEKALGFDREEGSVYLQPDWQGAFWNER